MTSLQTTAQEQTAVIEENFDRDLARRAYIHRRVSLTAGEDAKLRAAAATYGLPVSTYIRKLIKTARVRK